MARLSRSPSDGPAGLMVSTPDWKLNDTSTGCGIAIWLLGVALDFILTYRQASAAASDAAANPAANDRCTPVRVNSINQLGQLH